MTVNLEVYKYKTRSLKFKDENEKENVLWDS